MVRVIKMSKPGKFYGVGVGPGDPEALTLKAKRVLEQVEVIFVPKSEIKKSSLAWSIISQMLKGKAKIYELVFPMTKDEKILNQYWAKAADKIASELFKGKDAAFITIGDPLLYSTYIYVFHLLKARYPDLCIETLSGISAPFASAATAGVSLAEGEEKLAILPVTKDLQQELPPILEHFDTVILLKVGSKLEKVLGVLEKLKVLKSSVFVSHVGGKEEYVERDFTRLKGKDLGYLSVIIIKKPKR
jgi:precorrin-2/cobalt-factor-2 C20-methyltransferase